MNGNCIDSIRFWTTRSMDVGFAIKWRENLILEEWNDNWKIILFFLGISFFGAGGRFCWPACKSKTGRVHIVEAPKLKVCYFSWVAFGEIVAVLFPRFEKMIEVTFELINFKQIFDARFWHLLLGLPVDPIQRSYVVIISILFANPIVLRILNDLFRRVKLSITGCDLVFVVEKKRHFSGTPALIGSFVAFISFAVFIKDWSLRWVKVMPAALEERSLQGLLTAGQVYLIPQLEIVLEIS